MSGKSAALLREQAQALILRARAAEVEQRRSERKRRDRAAYVIGGYLLRRRPDDVSSLLAELSEQDQALVTSVLPTRADSNP